MATSDSRLSDARTPTAHNQAASTITSGQLALARGGTGADLSATGPGYLKQGTAGATATVVADIPYGDLTYSGLTVGTVLRATATGAAAFGAVDLANASAITGDLSDVNLSANVPLKDALNVFSTTQRITTSGDATGTNALEIYGNTMLRSYINNFGAQLWYLNNGGGADNGIIGYTVASGAVALVFRAADQTARSDIRHLAGGGLTFHAISTSGVPPEIMRIEDTKTVLIGKTTGLTGAGELDVAGAIHGDKHVELIEITAPAAPAANGVRIYAEDNGAGKTRLMALFSSGAAVQIAIQP